MEEDIQILKDLYAHPMPIVHYAKANGYDPSRLQYRISSLGSACLRCTTICNGRPICIFVLVRFNGRTASFSKNLAVQYAAFHTRSLGRFLYKESDRIIPMRLSYQEYVGESDT